MVLPALGGGIVLAALQMGRAMEHAGSLGDMQQEEERDLQPWEARVTKKKPSLLGVQHQHFHLRGEIQVEMDVEHPWHCLQSLAPTAGDTFRPLKRVSHVGKGTPAVML